MRRVLWLLVGVIGVACSGSGEDGSAGDGATTGTASAEVSADDGGELVLQDSMLSVPASALRNDAELTVESNEPASSLPDRETVQGLVYDYGPDGTAFDPAATITLPVAGSPADDERIVIAWLDAPARAWVDLETTVNDRKASARVEHFSLFAVRFVATAGAPSCAGVDSVCVQATASYCECCMDDAACGGMLCDWAAQTEADPSTCGRGTCEDCIVKDCASTKAMGYCDLPPPGGADAGEPKGQGDAGPQGGSGGGGGTGGGADACASVDAVCVQATMSYCECCMDDPVCGGMLCDWAAQTEADPSTCGRGTCEDCIVKDCASTKAMGYCEQTP